MTAKDYIWKRRYRDELRRAVLKLAANPAASESVSTPNGGSRSVSYSSLAALSAEIRALDEELARFDNAIRRLNDFEANYARWC